MRFRDDRKRVMVVDDEDSIRELTAAWLSDEGFVVATARNGADALRQLRDFGPDVIVLDLLLPDVNGFELCRRLRSNRATAAIPIIFLSADESSVFKAMASPEYAPVFEILRKPAPAEKLLATIHTAIKESQM